MVCYAVNLSSDSIYFLIKIAWRRSGLKWACSLIKQIQKFEFDNPPLFV